MPIIMDPPAGAREQLVLDPAEEIDGRVEVNLHDGALVVKPDGPDFGESTIEQYLAKGRIGSAPVDFSLPNRQIRIPLIVQDGQGETLTEARIRLQSKAALIQRKGGLLRRTMYDGSVYYLQLVNAVLKFGGGTHAALGILDADAELTLDAIPDYFGPEMALDELTATGTLAQVLQLDGDTAIVPGDYPGRMRLEVVDGSGSDQLGLLYGLRCDSYSADPSAALHYAAQDLTRLDSAANATVLSAPVVRHQNLSTRWTPVLNTNLTAGVFLTHEGSYRVWARVHTTSDVPPRVRLVYDVGDLTSPAENRSALIRGANNFYLVDLGEVRLDRVPAGVHRWQGQVQARGAVGGEDVSVASLELVPLDEAQGALSAPLAAVPSPGAYVVRDEFVQSAGVLSGKAVAVAGATAARWPASAANVPTGYDPGREWTNASNATGDTVAAASSPVPNGKATNWLWVTGFGLAVPAGATIDGILLEVERYANAGDIYDNAMRVVKNGTMVGASIDRGYWPGGYAYQTYGAPNELFGASWSAADVNAADWGIAIRARHGGNGNGGTAYVRRVRATVYYTPPGGQAWASTGDADDFAVDATGHTLQRTAVSDADIDTGRYAIAGATVFTDIAVQTDCKINGTYPHANRHGVFARYTDANNWLMAAFASTAAGAGAIQVIKRVAGTVTTLASIADPTMLPTSIGATIRLAADPQGRWFVWVDDTFVIAGQDTDLATGGTLATGNVGIYDAQTSADARTRNFDNFAAYVPAWDAVLFANLSAELSTDGMSRQDATGAAYGPVSNAPGDPLRVPPSGLEERPVELFLRGSRGDLDQLPDGTLDPVRARPYVRASWLAVPGA